LTVLLPRAQVAAPLPRPQAASPLPRAQSVAPLHESPVHLPLMPPSSSSSPADLELIGNLQNQIALQQQLLQLQQQSQQLIGRALPTLGQTPPHPSPTSMSSASIVYSPESELATDLPLRDVNNLKIFLNWNFYGGGGNYCCFILGRGCRIVIGNVGGRVYDKFSFFFFFLINS